MAEPGVGRARVAGRRAVDPDAAMLRRVRLRFAALTVALLCAMLVLLGVGVYTTTKQALLSSLEETLSSRLHRPPPFFGGLLVGEGPRPPFRGPGRDYTDSRGVFFTVVGRNLAVLGGSGPAGHPLFDQAAATQALRTGGSVCCTQQTYQEQHYLTYSVPVATAQDGPVVGVLQASISEVQYESTLQTLVRTLLLGSILGLLASGAISMVLARRAVRPMEVALRRQRDFVADAAHELRTPLAIQRTAGELGLAAITVPEAQVAIEQSLVQNAHLTGLVDALSLLARADSGELTLERQPVDLARLVRETADGVEALAEEKGLQLTVEAPQETTVVGDAGRLRQLLLIMLDNALKYTPTGGSVQVRVERRDGRAQLQVRDTGVGITPQDLPHIFDRFYRADHARSGEGSGLGLAIGRWIAEAHGGNVSAANAPDRGALFTVALPLSR